MSLSHVHLAYPLQTAGPEEAADVCAGGVAAGHQEEPAAQYTGRRGTTTLTCTAR